MSITIRQALIIHGFVVGLAFALLVFAFADLMDNADLWQ